MSAQPPAVVQHLSEADRRGRASPTSAEAVGALGMAYHADLFYDEAVDAYQAAVQLSPHEWRWSYLLALVHIERGEAAPAASRLRGIVAANPGFAVAWLRLGDAEFKRARYAEASDAYGRAQSAAGS